MMSRAISSAPWWKTFESRAVSFQNLEAAAGARLLIPRTGRLSAANVQASAARARLAGRGQIERSEPYRSRRRHVDRGLGRCPLALAVFIRARHLGRQCRV